MARKPQKASSATEGMACPNPGCGMTFTEGSELRAHMAECVAEGNGEPPVPELPPFESVVGNLSPQDANDLCCHIPNALKQQNDIRWAKLALQGSAHKDSGWYRKQYPAPGQSVEGLLDKIACILAANDIRGFRFQRAGADVDVYEVQASQPRLSRTKLLELGVDASTIAKATVRVPYTTLIVKTHTEKRSKP